MASYKGVVAAARGREDKPDADKDGQVLPPELQGKRSVVAIKRAHWNTWLEGTKDEAAALTRLPALKMIAHEPAGPAVEASLPAV